jgi:hypothetical protein
MKMLDIAKEISLCISNAWQAGSAPLKALLEQLALKITRQGNERPNGLLKETWPFTVNPSSDA